MTDCCNHVTLGGKILCLLSFGGRHVAVPVRNDYQRVGFAGGWRVSHGDPGDCEVGGGSRRLGWKTRRVGLAFSTFGDNRRVPKVDCQRTIAFLEASIGGI